MKKSFYRIMFIALAVVFACCIFLAGCFGNANSPTPPPVENNKYGLFDASDYLKVDGELIRKNYGQGDTVTLRGTNAGGYLLIEQWMTAITNDNGGQPYYDHKRFTDDLVSRFGESEAEKIWGYYRDQFWTEQDFANCADMGMTVIRLPFSYMNVDFNGHYDFGQLDKFVEGASEYGIYTILDLHGAYGSQNGKDHSGQIIEDIEDVDFYSNEVNIQKTVKLWSALTEHYQDNPCVAGFDILNEPGEHAGLTSERHWAVYDRIYDAIRSIDEDRIVIFESCWDAENLPHPDRYGWENCVYSYHNYAPYSDDPQSQNRTYDNKINGVIKADYGVPNYMGEFNCYENQECWEYSINLMEENGWHWTSWAYKVNINSAWGIFNTSATPVNALTDSVDDIEQCWTGISTDNANRHVLDTGKTLYDLIKEACNKK